MERLHLLSKMRIIICIIIRLLEGLNDTRTGKHLFTAWHIVGSQQRVELLLGVAVLKMTKDSPAVRELVLQER